MKKVKLFEEFINESHYNILGGDTPLQDFEMRKDIVEPNLGKRYNVYVMFDGPKGEYDEMKNKYANDTNKWIELYRSSSNQGYARISPNGKVIKASVLSKGGIVGAIYVKK